MNNGKIPFVAYGCLLWLRLGEECYEPFLALQTLIGCPQKIILRLQSKANETLIMHSLPCMQMIQICILNPETYYYNSTYE